jgi:predicted HNH restriction endonuclease
MSARVEQILEVIQELRERYRASRGIGSLSQMRVDATHAVADRRSIDYRSVQDKFIRQLRPDISTASQFDKLIGPWLKDGSATLKDIVMKHRSDKKDGLLIENAFYIPSEEEALLADAFGYDPNDIQFKEGRDILRLHLTKERNQYLTRQAKALWLGQTNGDIRCSICSFSFSEKYGQHGDGYIEAHHTLPVSGLKPDTVVRVTDLVPVCSNCHSIIHRSKPLLSVETLKQAIMHQETVLKKQGGKA